MSARRVLVVDDDRDFAESLADVLELHGCKVTLAFRGDDALQHMQREPFDLTFLDIRMPGIGGVESLARIREHRPHARVVMMTGYSLPEEIAEVRRHGAVGVLRKPLDLDAVIELVNGLARTGAVLVADDDPIFLEVVQTVLERAGYRTTTARDGAEALERIRADPPEVLILDLRLPGLDGVAVYRELHEMGLHVPTIVVTAFAVEESERLDELRALRVERIFSKPIDPEVLIGAVRTVTPAQ